MRDKRVVVGHNEYSQFCSEAIVSFLGDLALEKIA